MKALRFGITSRILFPVVALFIVGVISLLFYVASATRRQVINASVRNATATIDQFKLLRGYYTDSVVKKVKGKSELKISFDHQQRDDTIPLPATMVQDLSVLLAQRTNGNQIRLYSAYPFPVRKNRALDGFMESALASFATNGDGAFVRTESDGHGTRVRVAIADKMVNASCVNCHNSHPDSPKKDWKLNDVRGVLEVEASIDSQLAANRAMLLQIAFITLGGVGLIIITVGVCIKRMVTKPVLHSVESLRQCSDQVSAAAGQISAASSSLAEGASEQAASLEETSASLEEISSMTRRNSENAQAAEKIAGAARQAAADGASGVQEMNQAMEAIRNSSDNIGKIIKSIDEIAFQTNILALNAAVEAARAGEAGMGFAVVADEVRNLAQRSAKAARETAESIEDSVRKSAHGVELSSKVAGRLADIVEKAGQVDALVMQISRASKEQSEGIGQVTTAVSQMDRVTQSNAATAEESASAATELHGQAAALQSAVEGLLSRITGSEAPKPTAVAKFTPAKSSESSPQPTSMPRAAATPPARSPVPAQEMDSAGWKDF
jgi:hypothetical protein